MKCSICGDAKTVQVQGTYWLCGKCVFEKIESLTEAWKLYSESKAKITELERQLDITKPHVSMTYEEIVKREA